MKRLILTVTLLGSMAVGLNECGPLQSATGFHNLPAPAPVHVATGKLLPGGIYDVLDIFCNCLYQVPYYSGTPEWA